MMRMSGIMLEEDFRDDLSISHYSRINNRQSLGAHCADGLAVCEALAMLTSNSEVKIDVPPGWVEALTRKNDNPHIECNDLWDDLDPNDPHVIGLICKGSEIEVMWKVVMKSHKESMRKHTDKTGVVPENRKTMLISNL